MKRHLILALAVASFATACAYKKPMAKPEPTPVAEAKPADTGMKAQYVVKPGDSLWKIASKGKVLGDPFRWPLIFKANRDQIQDPDFIEARQDLSFKKNYTKEEIEDAVKKAQITPPFEPRKQPRKVLPIQY
jgi:hypothetical protein